MAKYGVEYDGFAALAMKIEELGVSMDEIADKVLEETAPIAVNTFRPHVPYDSREKDSVHDFDNRHFHVVFFGQRVGVFTESGGSVDWTIGRYLFYVENGTSKMTARPFMAAASSAVESAVKPIMKSAIENEIKSRIGG